MEQARSFGNYTSMVTFFNIDKDLSIHEYQHTFWSILTRLHNIDLKEWPESIPNEENDPLWEFCFHGEPIFVVCNTPAHEMRRSRRANTYMITFQPRWVFDSIGLGTPKGDKSKDLVRSLLRQYDAIDPFPHLGIYGSPNNREWLQYFIPDTNEVSATAQCPFHHMRRNSMSSVQYIQGSDVTLEEAVMQLLPVTGSVEVQRDTPFREHKSHTHPTDETLLIISGDITFYTEEGSCIARLVTAFCFRLIRCTPPRLGRMGRCILLLWSSWSSRKKRFWHESVLRWSAHEKRFFPARGSY